MKLEALQLHYHLPFIDTDKMIHFDITRINRILSCKVANCSRLT